MSIKPVRLWKSSSKQHSETTETTKVNPRLVNEMDKPRHPQVIRTWKVERIRKPAMSTAPKKYQQVKRTKKSKDSK
ncbi:MAG: hypothetical protein DMG14_18990 [Acidobacteria bacterium]|nr:MAG: hypothetical protein DMG14_18990 [Acidobacteriota bacterium]